VSVCGCGLLPLFRLADEPVVVHVRLLLLLHPRNPKQTIAIGLQKGEYFMLTTLTYRKECKHQKQRVLRRHFRIATKDFRCLPNSAGKQGKDSGRAGREPRLQCP
jgi:hypothetical protein